MSEGVYVVVAENDLEVVIGDQVYSDDGGPLVFEQYTRMASLELIKQRRDQVQAKYGKCRIAKLEFIDE